MPPRPGPGGLTPLGGAKRQKAGDGAKEGTAVGRGGTAMRRGADKAPPPQARPPSTLDESDEEGEEGGMDLATLQAMMLEVVRKRKQGAQRKQAAMIAELEGEVAAALAAKEKELAASQKGLDEAVAKRFAQLEKQLDGKMREIDAATLAFQQQLATLWEQYRKIYDGVEATAAEVEASAAKQSAAAAKSLEALREGLAAKAAEVARRIERANKRAGKMPELAQMLAPFLS